MWVFDATPLIYLAKADALTLAWVLDGRRVVPEPVYEEVVEAGIREGYPDARRIERAVDDGSFEVMGADEGPATERLRRDPNLSGADVAVLTLAYAHDGTAVMDEAHGRTVASIEGIPTRGTAYVVLLAATEGEVEVADARTVIDRMVERGWYCAPPVYARIVRNLESIES
jgi:predicted nucleic acid-binding protein